MNSWRYKLIVPQDCRCITFDDFAQAAYRRILEHSHTDENGTADADMPGNTFTRSGGPVPIAADTVVLVRAHMSTGGYNGRVMRGSPSGGFVDAPDITSTFAAGVEADPPQSVSCDF